MVAEQVVGETLRLLGVDAVADWRSRRLRIRKIVVPSPVVLLNFIEDPVQWQSVTPLGPCAVGSLTISIDSSVLGECL